MNAPRKMVIAAVATAAFAVGLFWNGAPRIGESGFLAEAQARVDVRTRL